MISTFLVFAGALSLGGGYQLIFGIALFVLISFLLRVFPDRRAFQMVWRLRWLFLSLCLIYWFATPGTPVSGLIPQITEQGLMLSVQRCSMLIILVLSLRLLLRLCPQQELLQGLYWLLWPLKYIGFNHHRITLRLALTLQFALQLGEEGLVNQSSRRASGLKGRISSLADAIGVQFVKAIDEKNATPELRVPLIDSPRLYLWLLPLFLLIVMLAVELPT